MTITASMDLVVSVLLVATRLGALLLLSPLLAFAGVPVMFRVLLLLALGFVLVLGLDVRTAILPLDVGSLALAMIFEMLVGALFAFGVFAAFGAFLFGGRILDFQMGFGVANLIDPATNIQSPLIGTILSMMAVMTFYMLDGHHLVLRGIATSFQHIPIGMPPGNIELPVILAQFGLMFSYGLALVAPPVITLLLIDVGMAFAARTMPQVNMFIVGLPLKIFAGIAVLALSLSYLSPLLKRIFESIFWFWEEVVPR